MGSNPTLSAEKGHPDGCLFFMMGRVYGWGTTLLNRFIIGTIVDAALPHPLADVEQTKHIVGPAAYAALALELEQAGDLRAGDEATLWAIEHVTEDVRDILLKMPARQPGKSRLDRFMYELDRGIRKSGFIQS